MVLFPSCLDQRAKLKCLCVTLYAIPCYSRLERIIKLRNDLRRVECLMLQQVNDVGKVCGLHCPSEQPAVSNDAAGPSGTKAPDSFVSCRKHSVTDQSPASLKRKCLPANSDQSLPKKARISFRTPERREERSSFAKTTLIRRAIQCVAFEISPTAVAVRMNIQYVMTKLIASYLSLLYLRK